MKFQRVYKPHRTDHSGKAIHSIKSILSPAHLLLHLQKVFGNHLVGRLFQAKLTISQPGDALEKEADRVADLVMRMSDAKMKLKVEGQKSEQKSLAPVKMPSKEPCLDLNIQMLKGHGRPLCKAERNFFEPRFGRDFYAVRIHTDNQANEIAQAVDARALTVGNDVVFGQRQYDLGTIQGRKLLAHELAHVVQQTDGLRKKMTLGQPNGPHEKEADHLGSKNGLKHRESENKEMRIVHRKNEGESLHQAEKEGKLGKEKRWDIVLYGKEFKNLSTQQILAVLRGLSQRIRNWTEAERSGHKILKKIKDEHPMVGFVSEVISGTSMPPLTMWEGPLSHLKVAESYLDANEPVLAQDILVAAELDYRECHRRYYVYRKGTIGGAEVVTMGLKVTAATGMVATAVVTGGAAAILELSVPTVIASGAAGAYFYGRAMPKEAGLETATAFAEGVLTSSSFSVFILINGMTVAEFVIKNRDKLPNWILAGAGFLAARSYLKSNAPELYDLIFWFVLKEIALRVPESFGEKEAAKFLGILVGSLSKKAAATMLTTLKLILTVLQKALLQLPMATIKAVPITIKEYEEAALQLTNDFKDRGYDIDLKSAKTILKQIGNPETRAKLQQLSDSLDTLLTALN